MKRIHISLLVLFHLMVFASPTLVKAIHHHDKGFEIYKSVTLTPADKPCYVCLFEFVSFVETNTECYSTYHPFTTVEFFRDSTFPFYPVFKYYQLRAPPVAS